MKKKKILILSQVFYPEQFPINLISEKLHDFNYDVSTLTGYPTYPKFYKYKNLFKLFPSTTYYKKTKIYRVPIFPRFNNSSLCLILNYLSFVFSGIIFSFFLLFKKKIDYVFVYATSPILQALIGIFLKKTKKTKLIIWVQDLWPDSLEYTGYIKNKFLLGCIKKLVKYIYNQSDLLLVQSESFKRDIKKITNKKILVIPNPSKDFFLKKKINKKNNNIKFLYAGNIGKVQSVEKIVSLAKSVQNKINISFEIIGSGSDAKNIYDLIKKYKLKNLKYKKQKSYNEIKKEYRKADILIAILKKHNLSEKTIPSKIQAYMSAGKPLLCCIQGESAKLIKNANCGFVCKNGVKDLNNMVLKISKIKKASMIKLGINARQFFLNNFTVNVITSQIDIAINDLND